MERESINVWITQKKGKKEESLTEKIRDLLMKDIEAYLIRFESHRCLSQLEESKDP